MRSVSIGSILIAPGDKPTKVPVSAWNAQAQRFEDAGAIRRLNPRARPGEPYLVLAGVRGKRPAPAEVSLEPEPAAVPVEVSPTVAAEAPKAGRAKAGA